MKTRLTWQNIRPLLTRDWWAIVFLLAFPWVYFWRVTLGQAVWFTTDIMLLYHPLGVELGRALAENRLPLWSPNLLAGLPLFAEGHVATFYPPYLLLYKFLPAHWALSYAMLLHLSWMACGMYACARAMRLNIPGALLAGFIFSFNGLTLEKLYHTPILITSSWLPWLVFFQHQFFNSRKRIWVLLLSASFGLQLVAGFPQTALLSALTLGVFGLFDMVTTQQPGRVRRFLFATLIPLGLGAGLAAIQIIPTLELIQQSVRQSTLSKDFLTEYSLPPAFLAQFIFPYAQGEPIEHTNEYWAFFGIAPFALAILAPILNRTRRTAFLAMFVLVTLSLALGKFNPAYELVYQLPIFNLFRTPARYIFLSLFGAVLLSAIALDELSNRLTSTTWDKQTIGIGIGFGSLTGIVLWLTQSQSLEFWLSAWQWLAFIIGPSALGIIILAWQRKISRARWQVALIGLTFFELTSFAPPFLFTLAQLTDPGYVTTPPRVTRALGDPRVTDRLFTDLSVVPSVPAVRASLAPNLATVYGRQSAQAYSPLVYARYADYERQLSAPMLNLLNVRYFMLPLEPRTNRVAAPTQSLGWAFGNDELTIAPIQVSSLEIISFAEQVVNLPSGTVAAQIIITVEDGHTESFPLRVGIETDDWEWERANIQRSHAPIARTFPGSTRAYGKIFDAHTFRARYAFTQPQRIVALKVESALPAGRFCIESISLIENNRVTNLTPLTSKSNLSVAYMSDTVGVWENLDVMPRAFIVHASEIVDDAAAFVQLSQPDFPAQRVALLDQGQALQSNSARSNDSVELLNYQPEHIELRASTDRTGYLILADAWYPGWSATIDGKPTAIARADVLFRAVLLEPGNHLVEFDYRPMSLTLGAIISIASILLTFIVTRLWAEQP